MKKPNILLLFPDQHRGDWMPYAQDVFDRLLMNQLPLRMPNVERLMKNGVTFTRAISSSPVCAPARACLASGKRYHSCGVNDNKINYPIDQRTFYSVLKENGYVVGGVGKFDLHKASKWWGLDGWIEELGVLGYTDAIDNAGKMDAVTSGAMGPKDPYMKYLYDHQLAEIHLQDMRERKMKTHPTPLPEEAYCDNWLSRNGVEMLKQFPAGRPWFLMVNFTGPHSPFDVTADMKKRWEHTDFPLPNGYEGDEKDIAAIRQNYAAMLENLDCNIGFLLQEVESRGELDHTVVIYSSDHGEMLGDFNGFGKGRPERASVQIPLVIQGPGVKQGLTSSALVELQDLSATILDFCGYSMPEAEHSISLKPIACGQLTSHRPYQVSALKDWRMIADERYKLIVAEGKPARLYDVCQDPWENYNIVSAHPEIVNRLFAELQRAYNQ